eukprot:2939205-Amphidinium_carterae.1
MHERDRDGGKLRHETSKELSNRDAAVRSTGAKKSDTMAPTLSNHDVHDSHQTIDDRPKIRVTNNVVQDDVVASNVAGQVCVVARISQEPNVHDVDRQAGVQGPRVGTAQGPTDHRAGLCCCIDTRRLGATLKVMHHITIQLMQALKVVHTHGGYREHRSGHN